MCRFRRVPDPVGWVGVLAAFAALATYSVVAGQVIAYSMMSFLGEFAGQTATDAAQSASLYAGSTHALIWHTLFMGVTILIVSAGLRGGIERVVTVLMPIFFVMLFGLCTYALSTGAARKALTYLFSPDFSALTPVVVLAALGQAFFSVGVGAAVMITYGSFLSKDENIGGSIILPLGGLLLAIFVGWVVPRNIMRSELRTSGDRFYGCWRIICRYLAPVAVVLILILGIDAKFDFGINAMLAGGAGS